MDTGTAKKTSRKTTMIQPGGEPVLGGLVRGCRFEEVDVREREGIHVYKMPYDVGRAVHNLARDGGFQHHAARAQRRDEVLPGSTV